MMSGWIKLHRRISEHWLWKKPEYLKWWIDILIEVNHLDTKVLIKNTLYDCKRGSKLYSLDTWAKRWNTDKSSVRRFLKLLQNDSMIVLKTDTQTTHLTVCNYDSYQDERHATETQTTHKRHATETQTTLIKECNNDNNEKNENKNIFVVPTVFQISEYCRERKNNVDPNKFFDFYESKGWLIGKNKMKDWKAAVRTWEDKKQPQQKSIYPFPKNPIA